MNAMTRQSHVDQKDRQKANRKSKIAEFFKEVIFSFLFTTCAPPQGEKLDFSCDIFIETDSYFFTARNSGSQACGSQPL